MSIAEKAMAPHSNTLAWKLPWTEEPGRLQSMESLGVGHNWVTSLSLFTFMHWRRKWQPTPVFLPGESQGRQSWWAAVYGVTQIRTRLKRLSSSSSRRLIKLSIFSFVCWPLYIPFFGEKYITLGYFHVLAIVNSAAVNTGVHISFQIIVFSGYMPRNGIAEPYGNAIFSV